MVDWISAVANWVVAIGIFFLWRQVQIHRRALKDDHERSRRETAIQMMLEWAKKMNQGTNIITRFVDTLSKDQAGHLAREEVFALNPDQMKWVEALVPALGLKQAEIVGQSNKLTQASVSLIRTCAVNYLNMLEIALTAWDREIADREILEVEFRPLYDPQHGDRILEELRQVWPGAFPATDKFVQKIKEKDQSSGKEPLGK